MYTGGRTCHLKTRREGIPRCEKVFTEMKVGKRAGGGGGGEACGWRYPKLRKYEEPTTNPTDIINELGTVTLKGFEWRYPALGGYC